MSAVGDDTRGRVLVAGIGNVFLGDDGFGVEVAGRLDPATLPENVDVVDYGIRGVHLAYELLEGRHETLIMVDAVPLGEAPGTVAVLEVGPEQATRGPESADPFDGPTLDAHAMNPDAVLQVLRGIGGSIDRVLVVGVEPAVIEERMGLSDPVRAAVGEAVRVVTELARAEADRIRPYADPVGVG